MANRALCVLPAAVVLAASMTALGSYVLINDGTMDPSSWTETVLNPTGGFGYSVGQAGAGGNPDAYRTIHQFSTQNIAQGLVVHLHEGSVVGAVDAVGMSLDVNCFNGGTSAAVAFGLVIQQGETIYFGPTFTALTNSGWRTDLAFVSLASSDFHNGPDSPDFSGAGAPLRFGFFSSNGTGGGAPINSSSGVDNFIVAIFPPPCPADLNHDGIVNTGDLTLLLARFGQSVAPGSTGDINGDGVVTTPDLTALLVRFGQSCG